MKPKIFQQFKDVEKGVLWKDYKKYSAISVYDTLQEDTFAYLLSCLPNVKTEAIEITFNMQDKHLLQLAEQNGFTPIYHWYIYHVSPQDANLQIDAHIKKVKNRKLVKKELTDQVHELAQRDPSMFDKNGEEKGWYKAGKNCIACLQDEQIISVLTWQYEPQNDNIHIYLTYTLPEFRSHGYNSKLIDYVKQYASAHGVKTITVCTDTTEQNRVPNMLYKNNFIYFKTGFEKILKEK